MFLSESASGPGARRAPRALCRAALPASAVTPQAWLEMGGRAAVLWEEAGAEPEGCGI